MEMKYPDLLINNKGECNLTVYTTYSMSNNIINHKPQKKKYQVR